MCGEVGRSTQKKWDDETFQVGHKRCCRADHSHARHVEKDHGKNVKTHHRSACVRLITIDAAARLLTAKKFNESCEQSSFFMRFKNMKHFMIYVNFMSCFAYCTTLGLFRHMGKTSLRSHTVNKIFIESNFPAQSDRHEQAMFLGVVKLFYFTSHRACRSLLFTQQNDEDDELNPPPTMNSKLDIPWNSKAILNGKFTKFIAPARRAIHKIQ